MKTIFEGAEAKAIQTTYLGEKCILKKRVPKKYREPKLDSRILKERTRIECTLLSKAKKAGVRTPLIRNIDAKANEITMEFVKGKTLKEELLKCGKKKATELMKKCAKEIAKLHNAEIIHGDLTTTNILLHNKGLVFLDFGLGSLSQKTEDRAVDLLVFKKTFLATHFRHLEAWGAFEGAYSKEAGKGTLEKMKDVEARARYY